MRYIDSGARTPDQALATWLETELTPDVVAVRCQAGYYSADALGLFATVLSRLAAENQPVKILVGSNAGETLREDVLVLVELLGLPRSNGGLGVVNFDNALYHPKTYHLLRADGSQCAYIGSANFTPPAHSGRNVEAGILLDTRNRDSTAVLDGIASAVDEWFSTNRAGLTRVNEVADVDQLVADGLIMSAPRPRPPTPPGAGTGGAAGRARPRLRPLVSLPRLRRRSAATRTAPPPPSPVVAAPVSVPRAGYPPHLLFAPGATGPTHDALALSGAALPGGAVGIVLRLNRDTARIFVGGVGTTNITIPVPTASTLRFGIWGRREHAHRPRAEFTQAVRYLGRSRSLAMDPAQTNVMAYGYEPGSSGHKDIRMPVPAAVREFGARIALAGLPIPSAREFALLEWPTPAAPEFRLSFLQPGSPLFLQAEQLFAAAQNARQRVGNGACRLPAGVSPTW